MQLVTSKLVPVNLYTQVKRKKKIIKSESSMPVEQFIAPFCTNKAGEKTPKTNLQLLLNASCDCV